MAGGELQRKLYCKAKAEPAFRFYVLYDKICREDILRHAYRLARTNAGAPGVDGVSFARIEEKGLEAWLAGLREELVSKTYRPDPVRRVMIAKPNGGGERALGIPMWTSYCTSRKLSLGTIAYARGRGNPFAQCTVCRVGDGDGVGHPRLPLLSGYVAAFNPVIDDMNADAIPLANFIDGERSGRACGAGDPMLEADPAYHVGSEGLAS
jgi:hypothetical protein